MFEPGEYIRVVPLHHPKPAVSIDQLSRARRAREPGEAQDLFDGKPHPAPATAKLIYGGGPLISHVEVFTIFWGTKWGTTPSSDRLMKKACQTLLPRCLYQQACQRLVGTGGQLIRKQPAA